MEIKCKVSFTLPEELIKALDITDDTPLIASVSDSRITVEIVDEDIYTEDDLYGEDNCNCEDDCEYCEYYCPHCGKCVLDKRR